MSTIFDDTGQQDNGGELTSKEAAWRKILPTDEVVLGRAGAIPVYDERSDTWRVFRNIIIHPGVENCADPAKVDLLRQNAKSLLEHYPDTVAQLEKLGVRVKALLNREIKTYEDVVSWAESVFNLGPITKQPSHVRDAIDLAFDDFVIEVKSGRNPVYVIPAGPRGSGEYGTLDFSHPDGRNRYGPRHAYSKAAFSHQVPQKTPRYRGTTPEGEPRRGRGRPRKDGLVPGSTEARRADKLKKQKLERERAARKAARIAKQNGKPEQVASITKMPHKTRPGGYFERQQARKAQSS